MIDLRAIAAHYCGTVSGSSVSIPTPGHSMGDKGTHITLAPNAPDGCLVHCFNGSSEDALAVKDMLRHDGFLPERQNVPAQAAKAPLTDIAWLMDSNVHQGARTDDFVPLHQWEYQDSNGHVLYRKRRIDRADGAKSFLFEHPDGNGGWAAGRGNQKHVPYRLPELLKSEGPIFAAEGERCADWLVNWGLNATSSKDIEHADLDFLKGRTVIILPDNDEPGQMCAQKATKAIQAVGGRPVTVNLPGLPDKGDIIDWGGTCEDLIALASGATGKEAKPKKPWLIPAGEFLSQPSPPRWIIRDLFEEGAFGMIHGPSGSGKSFVMIDIAMHIAYGQSDWHGSVIGKHGPIVYLAGEGHYGMRRRLAAWIKHYGQELGHDELYISQSGCDLDQTDGYRQTVEAIRALPEQPILIVVDTLHRFLSGDENSAKDARAMISACDQLREEFGCALVLVHHTGVNAEAQHRARGSSAWKGAVDFEFSIEAKNETITMTSRKAKDGPEVAPRHFALHDVILDDWLDENDEPTRSVVILPAEPAKADRKDHKITRYLKWFEEAWFISKREEVNGRPYLSRTDMLAYLATHHNLAKRTAENHLAPSREGCFANALTSSGRAEVTEKGWTLVDPALSAALLIQRLRPPSLPLGTPDTHQGEETKTEETPSLTPTSIEVG